MLFFFLVYMEMAVEGVSGWGGGGGSGCGFRHSRKQNFFHLVPIAMCYVSLRAYFVEMVLHIT